MRAARLTSVLVALVASFASPARAADYDVTADLDALNAPAVSFDEWTLGIGLPWTDGRYYFSAMTATDATWNGYPLWIWVGGSTFVRQAIFNPNSIAWPLNSPYPAYMSIDAGELVLTTMDNSWPSDVRFTVPADGCYRVYAEFERLTADSNYTRYNGIAKGSGTAYTVLHAQDLYSADGTVRVQVDSGSVAAGSWITLYAAGRGSDNRANTVRVDLALDYMGTEVNADGSCVEGCASDADGDGTCDDVDPCPADADNDADGDTWCADVDNCPSANNADQADVDDDGLGDACDECPADADNDADADFWCGNEDNCPAFFNDDQADADGDAFGDACDVCPLDPEDDADGDGWCADEDLCDTLAGGDQVDSDGDGLGDACDLCPYDADDDADGDGVCGDRDLCDDTVLPDGVPTERLGTNRWADVDGNGVFDTVASGGKGPRRSYTLDATQGCSCEQIVDACDYGEGHRKFGCSISVLDAWIGGGCKQE